MTIDRSVEEPCEVTSLTHGFEAERRGRPLRLGSVVFAAELIHRGQKIKAALDDRRSVRRSRRNRKTRYRKPRWQNRKRKAGWLPPSLESRIANVLTWYAVFPAMHLSARSAWNWSNLTCN